MSLTSSVKGWVRYGFCPIEVCIRREGQPGFGQRLCLVATFCGRGDQDLFLGEYDSREQLDRARRTFKNIITRTWNKLTK